MGKRKDIQRDQSETPATVEAATPTDEAKAPAVEAAAAITSESEAPESEAPRPEMTTAETTTANAPPPETIAPAASNRFALLAASVALAAAFGAAVGSLGTMGLTYALAPSAKADVKADAKVADAGPNLPEILAQVGSDVGALKASIDASNRVANTQFSKIAERFDRMERRMAMAPAAAPEVTGSVATARPEVKEPPKPAILEGWVIRDIYRGRALVESRTGFFEIAPGSNLPGVGRIETITQQNGRWVVVTPKGLIVSMR